MNKKILVSLAVIGAVAAIAVGGTIAYFSDTETSTGNTFTAGAIDLKIDNHSYITIDGYLTESRETSWDLDDLTGHLFFNFHDLKPGDWGEDTVSIHVDNNDAWACSDIYITRNDDISSTEPELKEGDDEEDQTNIWDGELAQNLNFFFWIDDGDNVYEDNEIPLIQGPASAALQGLHYALADSQQNNVGGQPGTPGEPGIPLTGGETYYIGKIWCYGNLRVEPACPESENDPIKNQDLVTCDGTGVNNMSQTDSVMADVSFYAEQARNNSQFVCSSQYEPDTTLVLENKNPDTWEEILGDKTKGTLVFTTHLPTFNYSLDVIGLAGNTDYTLLYYADPWPASNGIAIDTFTTDASGNANVSNNVEINADLPVPDDDNYPSGAKIWVIPSTDWDGSQMSAWNPTQYLFEHNLVTYDDTDI